MSNEIRGDLQKKFKVTVIALAHPLKYSDLPSNTPAIQGNSKKYETTILTPSIGIWARMTSGVSTDSLMKLTLRDVIDAIPYVSTQLTVGVLSSQSGAVREALMAGLTPEEILAELPENIYYVDPNDIRQRNDDVPLFKTKAQCSEYKQDEKLVCVAVACANGA